MSTIEELRKLTIKRDLRPLAKSIKIINYSHMNKEEIVDDIFRIKNGGKVRFIKQKYLCKHNRQKYICILCDGSQICEHKKQKISCKKCRDLSRL